MKIHTTSTTAQLGEETLYQALVELNDIEALDHFNHPCEGECQTSLTVKSGVYMATYEIRASRCPYHTKWFFESIKSATAIVEDNLPIRPTVMK